MIDTQAARETILSKLQRSTSASNAITSIPRHGRLNDQTNSELFELFTRVLTAHNSTVTNIDSIIELPTAVNAYLQQLATGPLIFGGNNPLFNTLDWSRVGLQWQESAFTADGNVAIASAEYGIAETGTVVILGGKKNPTRNNFLAEHHIVVLKREHILPYSDAVWEQLLKQQQPLPRAINFISGPSSSADVGLKLEYGAHGPRTLAVFLY